MMIMLATIDFCFGKYVSFSLLSGNDVYWYLIVIIIYTLLTPIISKLNTRYLLTLSILLGLSIGYDNNIGDYLFLSRTITFFPFYCLGYYFSEKKESFVVLTEKKLLKLIFSWAGCFYGAQTFL